jgi:hypothetical protein
MSVGKQNPMKVYYHTRNRILYIRRNSAWYQRWVFYTFFAFFVAPKTLLSYLGRDKREHLKNFWKGVSWNLRSTASSPV